MKEQASFMREITPRAVLTALAGLGTVGSVIALDANSPQASAANTEITRSDGTKMTLMDNPEGNIDVQFLLKGVTLDQAKKLSEGLTIANPMGQYEGKFRKWAIPVQDVSCDIEGVKKGGRTACDPADIRKEVNLTRAAGITPYFTVVLAPSGDEFWGAGLGTLRDPFEPFSLDDGAHILKLIRNVPNIADQRTLAHEFGHLGLRLADARLITDSKTDVGKGYFNCSRFPLQTWGWVPNPAWRGCESDPLAYINNSGDIMRANGSNDDHFAPETWGYIDRVMSSLPRGFAEPYGMNLPTPPAVFRLQSADGLQVYRAEGLEFTLNPQTPPGTTCVELKVMPAGNVFSGNPDGPGYHNILCGDGGKSISFPKPEIGKGGYFLLPGMSYNWEYRVTDSATFLTPADNPGWRWNRFTNPYTGQEYTKPTDTGKILVPERYSDKISLVSPKVGETVGPKSTVQWTNGDTDVFYYEVQVSRDEQFQTDPDKAIAAVYWNLVHGGETTPINSWKVPDGYELEEGENWVRFRPRVQGDGTPVDWSTPVSFKVSKGAPNKMSSFSHPVYGWEPDADYGNGVIGPSAEDMKKWGKVVNYADSDLSVVKISSNGDVTIFNP